VHQPSRRGRVGTEMDVKVLHALGLAQACEQRRLREVSGVREKPAIAAPTHRESHTSRASPAQWTLRLHPSAGCQYLGFRSVETHEGSRHLVLIGRVEDLPAVANGQSHDRMAAPLELANLASDEGVTHLRILRRQVTKAERRVRRTRYHSGLPRYHPASRKATRTRRGKRGGVLLLSLLMWKTLSPLWGILLLVSLLGCGSTQPYVWVSEVGVNDARAPDTLRPGDRIQVAVYGQDALSGEFEIRPSGSVILPVVGGTVAAGRTTEQVAADLAVRLQGAIASPRVTVIVATRRPAGISVLGEVRTPGRYELVDGEGVLHALARAGGLTEFANRDGVYVVRPEASRRIRFRYADLTAAEPASARFQLRNGDVVVVE
jgi:polysaccharide export outer membrane protein